VNANDDIRKPADATDAVPRHGGADECACDPPGLDDAAIAGLVEYAGALREAYEHLRAEGFLIVDGILRPPTPRV